MSIAIKEHIIPKIITSTIMGHSGNGLFPLTLLPGYQRLMLVIKQRGVANFTKSSTLERHLGNFRLGNPLTWKYVRRFRHDGMLNAYGLTNRGVAVNAARITSAIQDGFRVIPNFYPQFAKGQNQAITETFQAIEIYSDSLCSFFWALELNLSCPNDKIKIRENMANGLALVKAVRQAYPNLCLIAKISIVHPYEFAQELVRAGADIIHAINTIPYDLVRLKYGPSPLAAVGGGGVSGGPAFPQAFEYNKVLRQRISAPLIMGCGVINLYAARQYFDIGADAVSLCTVCRLNPEEAIKIIEKYV